MYITFVAYLLTNFFFFQFAVAVPIWQDTVYDWKTWLEPFIFKIEGHSAPYVFYFARNEETQRPFMKVFPQHPIDEANEQEEYVLLSQLPPGRPKKVQPEPLKAEVKKDTIEQLR